MIILGEQENGMNILHIIIGPETETQFNFTGQSIMDITNYIKNLDPDLNCMLVINRCESEEEIMQILAERQMRQVAHQVAREMNQQFENPSFSGNKTKKIKQTSNNLKCPVCLRDNAATIKNGLVQPCKQCQQIDRGLKSKKIPTVPHEKSLDQIKKELEEEHPELKSIIEKYNKKFKEEEDDNI